MAAGLVAFTAAATRADTVWTQEGGNGGLTPSSPQFWTSDNAGDSYQADNFTLSAATSITAARWWGLGATNDGNGSYAVGGIDAFVVEIFAASGGIPTGSALYSTSIAVGNVTWVEDFDTGLSSYQYDVDLAGCSLAGGEYFFSVFADATNENVPEAWGWQGLDDNGDGTAYRVPSGGATWYHQAPNEPGYLDNLAFELFSVPQNVPLPMPALLGGIGLLSMIPLRRRMMKDTHG